MRFRAQPDARPAARCIEVVIASEKKLSQGGKHGDGKEDSAAIEHDP